jgi:hypothetical protein
VLSSHHDTPLAGHPGDAKTLEKILRKAQLGYRSGLPVPEPAGSQSHTGCTCIRRSKFVLLPVSAG